MPFDFEANAELLTCVYDSLLIVSLKFKANICVHVNCSTVVTLLLCWECIRILAQQSSCDTGFDVWCLLPLVVLSDALRKFYDVNGGSLPQYIVIYRDGVGDGQVLAVREHEVPQIKESIQSLQREQQWVLLKWICCIDYYRQQSW